MSELKTAARLAEVLHLVKQAGPLTVDDLMASTGWTRPTVLKYGKILEDKGLIAADKAGRLPTLYEAI
jgi:DNA-binding IclR family transcriptional regulator